jgi:hypothetical protein
MEAHSDYVYETLKQPDRAIRLLNILSTSPQIRCVLTVVSLDDLPNFTTLSYVWGDPYAREALSIGGKSLKITSSLASALQDVFGHWKSIPAETASEQWLWADGICINQEDDEEKNHQVPLMGQIYSKAYRMFSWLGVEDEATRGVLDALNLVAAAIQQLPGYDSIMAELPENSFPLGSSIKSLPDRLGQQTVREFTNFAWLENRYNTSRDQEDGVQIFTKVLSLFGMKYWSRLWIFQELVLAQDTTLLCGKSTTSWTVVCQVFFWILLVRLYGNSADKPHWMPKTEWTALIHEEYSHRLSTVSAFKDLCAIDTTDTERNIDQDSESLPEQSFIEMKQREFGFGLHYIAHQWQATNPKDYIYAMGGVSGYRSIPDYSSKTSVAQVYQNFVSDHLATVVEVQERNMSLPEDPCILMFLALAGTGLDWRITPDLPTWVPDFAGVAKALGCSSSSEPSAMFDRTRFSSDKGLFAQNTRLPKLEGPALCCIAILVDEVCRVGPLLRTKQYHVENDVESQGWLLWFFDCVVESRASKQGLIGYNLFLAMIKVIADESQLSHEESAKMLELLVADLAYHCETHRGLRRAEFANQLCKELSQPETDDLLGRSEWSYSRTFREGKLGTMDMARTADSLLYRKILVAVNKLCIAFMISGLIGLLPPLAQAGDIVGVIIGFTLPVVLRKNENGYRFVGPCHVPGIMDGEAGDMLQDGRAKLKEIRIH